MKNKIFSLAILFVISGATIHAGPTEALKNSLSPCFQPLKKWGKRFGETELLNRTHFQILNILLYSFGKPFLGAASKSAPGEENKMVKGISNGLLLASGLSSMHDTWNKNIPTETSKLDWLTSNGINTLYIISALNNLNSLLSGGDSNTDLTRTTSFVNMPLPSPISTGSSFGHDCSGSCIH